MLTLNIPFTYDKTIKWLKDNNYYKDAAIQYDTLYKVEAYILNKNDQSGNKVTITDKKLRRDIFDNADNNLTERREFIIVKFTYPITDVKDMDEYDYLKDSGRKTFKMYYNINQDNPLYDQIIEQYDKYGQS